MHRARILFCILILGFLTAPLVYCQDYSGDDSGRTFEGTVTSIDTGSSILVVKGISGMSFPISLDTKISKGAYEIKLSDIAVGDYVKVDYIKGDNGPSKVLNVVVAYGKTGE